MLDTIVISYYILFHPSCFFMNLSLLKQNKYSRRYGLTSLGRIQWSHPPLCWSFLILIPCGEFQTYKNVDYYSGPSHTNPLSPTKWPVLFTQSFTAFFLPLWCKSSSSVIPKVRAWFTLLINKALASYSLSK